MAGGLKQQVHLFPLSRVFQAAATATTAAFAAAAFAASVARLLPLAHYRQSGQTAVTL
jgi:hypothetical protein